MPPDGIEWEVEARGFPGSSESHEAWERVLEAFPNGDYSCWNTTTPDQKFYALVVCGRPEAIAGVLHMLSGAEIIALNSGEAHAFCARRLRGLMDGEIVGSQISQIESYEGGKRLEEDGSLSPFVPENF